MGILAEYLHPGEHPGKGEGFPAVSVLYAPQIRDDGTLGIRSNRRYIGPPDEDLGIIEISPRWRRYLQGIASQRLGEMDDVLRQTARRYRKIYDGNPNPIQTKPKFEQKLIRQTVKELFPPLREVINSGKERLFLREESLQNFVTKMLKSSYSFRSWILDHLPENGFHQPLGLLAELENPTNLLDVTKLIPSQPAITDYELKMGHQIATILGDTYVAALVDLSRDPLDEVIMNAFDKEAAASMANQTLTVSPIRGIIDSEGRLQIYRVGFERDPLDTREFNYDPTYIAVRRWGPKGDDYAILDQRLKDPFSEMFKIERERDTPIYDRIGVRYVVEHRNQCSPLIAHLQKNMPTWSFRREVVKTPSPQSTIPNQEVYYAKHEDYPDYEVEIQIYWLMQGMGDVGTWIRKKMTPDQNDEAFKMKQLMESFFPWYFPTKIYGIDWKDPKIRRRLLDHANQKSLKSLLTPPETVSMQ